MQVIDDQQKPDVGVQAMQKLVQSHKSHFITGVVFSNVLLPAVPVALDAKTFFISPNTGPADYAGAKCNPYFFVASWQNEDVPGAMGKYVTDRGLKNVMLIGANYRFEDAISPFFGFTYKNMMLGASYDINSSDLGKLVNGSNSFEISLSIIGKKSTKTPEVEFVCPRL